MAVSERAGAEEYIVHVASKEVSKASVHLTPEPCRKGQSSWRAFCLPVVVTLGAPTARTLQGARVHVGVGQRKGLGSSMGQVGP